MALAGLACSACAPVPPERAPPIAERITGSYAPTAAARQALLKRQALFWEALDAGRPTRAYAMLTWDLREMLPLARFRIGHPRQTRPRQIDRMHWLKDAPHMPGPEVFCVVLWSVGAGGGPRGELVWRLEPDGQFYIQSTKTRGA